MKIELPIGVRATLEDFKKSYTIDFLRKHGYEQYTNSMKFSGNPLVMCETVQTKYGQLVVHDFDVLTYVGKKHWSVDRK